MSNVVQFLEALSLDPSNLTEEDYAEAVAAANFDSSTREALLKRDSTALNTLLGGRGTVMAFIMPAEEEQDDRKDGDPQPDDGDSEGPEHVQEQSSLAA
jgi:hypothetical protein